MEFFTYDKLLKDDVWFSVIRNERATAQTRRYLKEKSPTK